jgi:hypothetical protein
VNSETQPIIMEGKPSEYASCGISCDFAAALWLALREDAQEIPMDETRRELFDSLTHKLLWSSKMLGFTIHETREAQN